jgi:23S rRNA (uracil1939-C5)-methyltransferase
MTDSASNKPTTKATPPFDLEITGMAHGGNAIGRLQGRTIFVPYALPGERITARLTQDRGRFAYAEAIGLKGKPSTERAEPPCPHFGPGKCGGCHWQHIKYDAQLRFKEQIVRDQLQRLGGVVNPIVYPAIPSPDPWHYRSHVTFSVADNGKLGFIGTDNEKVVPVEDCLIMRPELSELFHEVEFDLPTLARVRMQVGSESADVLLALTTSDDQPPGLEVDIRASVNFLPSDNVPINLVGSTHVRYTIKHRTFRVTAGGFFQVNIPQAEKLVELVLDRLNLQGDESVLDLYSGVGLFTAFLAERASLVTSVESYPPAVTDADENLADLENVELIEGSVEDVLGALDGPFDAVVVDPPRQGLEGVALDSIVRHHPKIIVYVSCDPATLARDTKRFATHGYYLRNVQPVDMFPQTYHIEAVAVFDRAQPRSKAK